MTGQNQSFLHDVMENKRKLVKEGWELWRCTQDRVVLKSRKEKFAEESSSGRG